MSLFSFSRKRDQQIARYLNRGIRRGWISDVVCDIHDGVPLTEEEEADFDEGGDPCIPVVRVMFDG